MIPVFVLTIGDFVALSMVIIVLGFGAVIGLIIWWCRRTCKHDGEISETSACDAICGKCGKNLGFIGTWRARQNRRGLT